MAKICEFIGCDKELTGRQTRFCSEEHKQAYYRMVNKPYYTKYNHNYYLKHKKEKYCVVCGKPLPKYKKTYCSLKCYLDKYKSDNNPNHYGELPRRYEEVCDECGGRVVLDGFDYVCSNCGLVIE